MGKNYKRGDVIEYLGVRYYVLRECDYDAIDGVAESWMCIDGYSFNIAIIPKEKRTELIGKSRIVLKHDSVYIDTSEQKGFADED